MPENVPEAVDPYEAAKEEVKRIRTERPNAGIEDILRVADKRFSHIQLAHGLIEAGREERERSFFASLP